MLLQMFLILLANPPSLALFGPLFPKSTAEAVVGFATIVPAEANIPRPVAKTFRLSVQVIP